jgi:hypothetical protein
MRTEVNKTFQFKKLQCWYYRWEGFMKYAVEMASGGLTCIPVFIKISSGVQKLLGGVHMQTHTRAQTARLSQTPTFIFSK